MSPYATTSIPCLPQHPSSTKLILIKLFSVCWLIYLFPPCSLRAADPPLNVLLITADDLNADSSGWMGNKLGVTPNLDDFAKSAHRFINHHVTVPICQPGRSALMTGRVPHRNGALGFDPIRRDIPTLVEVLRNHGYYTAAIAKTAHMTPAEKFPWDAVGEQALGKQPANFAQVFRKFMTTAKEQNKPFFINANICDPHRPFINGNANNKKKANAQSEFLSSVRIFKPNEVTVPAFLEDIPPVREEVAQYYSTVSRFDVAFGLLMQELKASGREDDTIVLFLSDHGMSFPFSKATVYYNGTWSPVLLRIPSNKPTETITELVSSVDIMPTLLELLGISIPEGLDGRSWVALLNKETQPNRDFVITHVNTVSSGKSLAQRCIRTSDRALMFHAWVGGPESFRVEAMSGLSFAAMKDSANTEIQSRVKQLVTGERLMFFNTLSDPTERKNLLEDGQYRSDIERLGQKLLDYMRQTDDPLADQFSIELAAFISKAR